MFESFWNGLVGRASLIAPDDTWSLLFVLTVSVALSIHLEQKYHWASKISGAIIALIIALVLANVGIIPTASVLYDDIVWGIIVPMGIPLLLLQCDLSKIWKQTGSMLIVFIIGAIGTVAGALLAYFLLKGPYAATGGDVKDLAGVATMMTGSYIGGGVNFAAMAAQLNLAGTDVTAAATVADNLLMAVYFFVLIAIAGSNVFRNFLKHPHIDDVEKNGKSESQTQAAAYWKRKDISLKDIALNIAYSVSVVWLSQLIAGFFKGLAGDAGNVLTLFVQQFLGSQYVWITTISVIVATVFNKQVSQLSGSQEIGTYLIYLFLFVIGVPANIYTVITKSPLFLVFTAIMVLVNMLFCFIGAKLSKSSLEDGIIASNANIGGPTTAAGMAISQGWTKLVGPAMLVGTLGYVLGNYAGTIISIILKAA